jgi:hypothetical protein
MISSHTGFQSLKEVWPGDCYPAEWYCDFDNQAQDIYAVCSKKNTIKNFSYQTKIILS